VAKDSIFDLMGNAMTLRHRPVSLDTHVQIDIVVEAHLADLAFVQTPHARTVCAMCRASRSRVVPGIRFHGRALQVRSNADVVRQKDLMSTTASKTTKV
jgi:hypothetical protein